VKNQAIDPLSSVLKIAMLIKQSNFLKSYFKLNADIDYDTTQPYSLMNGGGDRRSLNPWNIATCNKIATKERIVADIRGR